jgi:F-type H+-transporting ATPase subunit delta
LIFTDNLNDIFLRFIQLLLEKERIKNLDGILREYILMASKAIKKLNIKVISSIKLDDDIIEKIKSKYRALYKANTVEVESIIDNSILGGIKLVIGDTVIDSSLKGRLESLKALK